MKGDSVNDTQTKPICHFAGGQLAGLILSVSEEGVCCIFFVSVPQLGDAWGPEACPCFGVLPDVRFLFNNGITEIWVLIERHSRSIQPARSPQYKQLFSFVGKNICTACYFKFWAFKASVLENHQNMRECKKLWLF